ncbi:MAG: VanZ family protein [Clostridia bacterium]|nr:VanZ family protein [Clostridia bacterium]
MKKYILLMIAGLLILFSICIDLAPNLILPIKEKLIIYIIAMLLVYIDMKMKNKREENKIEIEKNRKIGITLIFIIYSILLVTLLFFDGNYRRMGFKGQIKIFSKEHFEFYSNIVPFATITSFFTKYIENNINLSIVVINILGNIIAFAPFGIFLPILYKDKINNIKKFILTMIIIVFIVECIQFITKSGTFDVDDIILNVLGATIMYGITRIKKVKELIEKILI